MLSKFFKILFKVFLDTLSCQQLAVNVMDVFDNYAVGKLKIPTRNHKIPDEKHAAYTHLLLIQFGSRICKRKGFLF